MTRKYSVYKSMSSALDRDGLDNFGRLTTFLLDTFLENGGVLFAKQVVKAGLCQEGKFKEWRELLIKKKWICYDYDYARACKNLGKHTPGKRLNTYLNKEKNKSHTLVTQPMLDAELAKKVSVEEFEALKRDLDRIRETVETLAEVYLAKNPPDTPARRQQLMSNFEKGIYGIEEDKGFAN